MNGLELARHFYLECVRPILAAQMPEVQNAHAAGLIGYGSDVLGNDDELSRDHEWGPRLILFLDGNSLDEKNGGEQPTRLAQKLNDVLNTHVPLTFMGFSTRFLPSAAGPLVMVNSATGKPHINISTTQKFLESTIGYRGVPATDREWLLVPEQRLLEFTSGEIFYDSLGQVTTLRKQLAYFPAPIWKYRLAYTLESLGWELGLISLCAKRGDLLSMHLNVAVTIKHIMQLTFLANRQYCPSYAKWLQRQFDKLPLLADKIEPLLNEAFAVKEASTILANLDQALAILYAHLRTLEGLHMLPSEMPRIEARDSITIDTQETARLILQSIPGPLGQLSIRGAPYGAADQWITHADMLLSPVMMKRFAGLYGVEESSKFDV